MCSVLFHSQYQHHPFFFAFVFVFWQSQSQEINKDKRESSSFASLASKVKLYFTLWVLLSHVHDTFFVFPHYLYPSNHFFFLLLLVCFVVVLFFKTNERYHFTKIGLKHCSTHRIRYHQAGVLNPKI
jgi:hypothetical protein